jgi:hypothetical protein
MRTGSARVLEQSGFLGAVVVWVAIVLSAPGCSAERKRTRVPASPTYPDVRPCLRLMNVGERSVDSLTVMFPTAAVYFGDLAAGASTVYHSFPRGVYQYAAFGFSLDGHQQIQSVFDWLGAGPMAGEAFTYAIALVETRPGVLWIQLVEARRDL